MKKKASKLFSIMLAFVMVFSMAVTGFAASSSDDTEFSITVTHAADGETYSAYKIFDVTYTDEDEEGILTYSYTINSNSAWYSTVSAATDVFILESDSDSITYTVTVREGVEDEAVIAVFTNANIDLNGVTAAATATATTSSDGDSEVTAVLDVTQSGPGYYYVTTTLGSLVIIDTTDPAVEVGDKNGIPTLSKWVHNDNVEYEEEEGYWGHEDDASNNTEILFEIEIDNINGATNLVLHDSMDDELEIPDKSNFHMRSVVLYRTDPYGGNYVESEDKKTLTENTDYTVSVGECSVEGCELNNCAFELDFTGYDFSDVDDTGYIELTYELHLNTEGNDYNDSVYGADVDEIENAAQVTFGISSFSSIVYAETYSFGFEVYKYTGDMIYNDSTGGYDSSTTRPVSGVEFELRDSDGDSTQTAYFLEETVDGKTIYLFEGWGTPDENSVYTQTIVSGSDGMVYIEGLDTGTYYLYETKARDGYNALSDPVEVTIWANYDIPSGALLTHGVDYSYDGDSGNGVVNIQNNVGTILPGTGGMGTAIFYIVGIVLILGAAVVFVTKKRLEKK